jgi:hypothetical protein
MRCPLDDDLIADLTGSVRKDLQLISEESWFFLDYVLYEPANDIARNEVV